MPTGSNGDASIELFLRMVEDGVVKTVENSSSIFTVAYPNFGAFAFPPSPFETTDLFFPAQAPQPTPTQLPGH